MELTLQGFIDADEKLKPKFHAQLAVGVNPFIGAGFNT